MARTLLVADDSTTIRKAVELSFLGEDVQVIGVASHDAAITKAREARPDAVIVDSSLPDGGGYALATAIKGDSATGAPPVLLLTSSRHPFDAAKGQAAGVDDSVDKPFESRVLIEKVTALFGKARAAAPAGVYREPAVAPPAAAHAPPPPPPAAMAVPAPKPPAPPPAAIAVPSGPRPAPTLIGTPSPTASPRPAPAAAVPSPSPVAVTQKPVMTRPDLPSLKDEKPATPPAAAPKPAAARAPSAGDGSAIDRAVAAGLTREQAQAIATLTREVVERIVWEVVPDLAEAIIREELARLTKD